MAGSAPTKTLPSVGPQGGANYVSAPGIENNGGRQLEQMGAAFETVGAGAAEIFRDELREMNEIRVTEQVNELMKVQDELTFSEGRGYTFLKGKNALDRPDGQSLSQEYGAQFDDYVANLNGQLSNDAQRKAFAKIAKTMGAGFRGDIEKYTAGETRTYKGSVLSGRLEQLTKQLSLSAGDIEMSEGIVGQLRESAAGVADLTGSNAGEDIDGMTDRLVSEGISNSIVLLMDAGDLAKAEGLFDRYKDDLTPATYNQISLAIGEKRRTMDASAIADAVFSGVAIEKEAQSFAATTFGPPVVSGFTITGKFGDKRATKADPNRTHKGVDYAVPVGTKISAAADGKIFFSGPADGYGNVVYIDHGNGLQTRYGHLSKLDVQQGAVVKKGQVIGLSGGAKGAEGSGNSSGPHMHYEVLQDGKHLNPLASHSTKGGTFKPSEGGGSGTPSLSEALAKVREATNDPRTRDLAEAEIRKRFQARDYDEGKEQEEALSAVYKSLIASDGNLNKVPSGLLGKLDGQALAQVHDYADRLSQPDPMAEYGPGWAEAYEGVASGRIRSINQLLPYRTRMTAGDFGRLVTDMEAAGKNRGGTALDSAKTAYSALSGLKTELNAIGIELDSKDKGKAETASLFKSKFYVQVQAAERAKGKPLTDTEARKIGLSLIGETSVDRPGWFTGNKRGYELNNPIIPYSAIPDAAKQRIASELRANNIEPTEAKIKYMYGVETGLIRE